MTPLEEAARAAQHAPSVFNTQPWRWMVSAEGMELVADSSRRIDSIDRDGRLLLLSCGAALHHARVALRAAGIAARVERLPEPATRPELLARITVEAGGEAGGLEERRLAEAIARRRTDRRAFGERPVTGAELDVLRHVVEQEGAWLHTVAADQVPVLGIAADRAGHAELGDPAYRRDLHRWTNRPDFSGDGVPPATGVRAEARRVPVRDFAPDHGDAGLAAGDKHDQGAAYVVLFGRDDRPESLLRGGEALSALLLRATADGLATAPLSDAVEVAWPRRLLRGILAGVGEPFLVVRLGYLPTGAELPAVPRRDPRDVITVTS